MSKVKNIADVVSGHLCAGCGVCSYLAPDALEMVDSIDLGKRPLVKDQLRFNAVSNDILESCPGWKIERLPEKEESIKELQALWGNVYEVWEGYATDKQVRKSGSSGGVITALSQYCLDYEGMGHVVNTAADNKTPYINKTNSSRTKEEMGAAAGSRYSPSSPCENLESIENSSNACVFVGKPCDVYAVHKARIKRPNLDKNLGLVLSFFCAGVPSTRGTLKLMQKMGVKSEKNVQSLQYRGDGWPGLWTVKYQENNELQQQQLTYQESWGELQKDRQWRCYICPDHVGEFADIAIGDPWYRKVKEGEGGRSLIIVRTERGRQILRDAQKQGVIAIQKCTPDILPRSQPNLIVAKNVLWGRLLALRLSGARFPIFTGFKLFELWKTNLTLKEQAKSIIGTAKRVYIKKLLCKQIVKNTTAM